MRALYFTEHGGLDKLAYGDLPAPALTAGMVRVATRAAALNRLDLFVVSGLPGVQLTLPHVPGSDGAGVVEAISGNVARFKVGEPVILNPLLSCGQCEFCLAGQHSLCVKVKILGEHASGTYAGLFVAPEGNLLPLPAGRTFEEGAAFSLVYQTAWRMLTTRSRLRAGEDVLIHGIGSGVSVAALQIAKLAGARVFVTSSSDEKIAKARALGADFGFNYAAVDVAAEVLRETGKRGVDVVVDSVGAATWMTSLKAVRRGGRIVTCGATTGPNPEAGIHMTFWKQIEILGSTMSSHSEYQDVARLFASGRLTPVVDRVFPLSEGREALEYLKAGKQFGKVVLRVGEQGTAGTAGTEGT
ncbi:MAG: alcohol dehydrogenase [Acidobacteria bacterium]|nr:MAG: alcohol dehydrogenase [Acidobacteriota bacterium]